MKTLSQIFALLLLVTATACTAIQRPAPSEDGVTTLRIGAIPDQDPELLQRLYGDLATYLSTELGVPVEYIPVTDYTAAVTAFRVGDLDLVWFGGLTGVQARLQVENAQAIVQRDIDAEFVSVFIANRVSGIEPFDDVSGLAALKGHSFTFGSESSTSGRLMPQYFLQEADVAIDEFNGEVGFSGAHDKTIALVEAGAYEAGALNSQVWESRVAAGEVDLDAVQVIWTTTPYYDYHWVLHPDTFARYGDGFAEQVQDAFLKFDPNVVEHQQILELFGAQKFITTENANYDQIEAIGRATGKITD